MASAPPPAEFGVSSRRASEEPSYRPPRYVSARHKQDYTPARLTGQGKFGGRPGTHGGVRGRAAGGVWVGEVVVADRVGSCDDEDDSEC